MAMLAAENDIMCNPMWDFRVFNDWGEFGCYLKLLIDFWKHSSGQASQETQHVKMEPTHNIEH